VSALPDPRARYCPLFCEENVWQLCDALAGHGVEALAIVVSNLARCVAVFHQRAARAPGSYVAWDYHVVLAVRDAGEWQIVDADTTLPGPCPAADYLAASFPDLPESASAYRPRFRVVEAAAYHDTLASDRRHMRGTDGGWLSEPPPWPLIGSGHNLDRFIDMDDTFVGEVLDLPGLRARLGVE